MANKQKTIEDFNIKVSKLKQEYLKKKMDFNLNYTFVEENYDTIHYFMITNLTQATKIIFDSEISFILEKEIFTSDAKKMLELQATL